MSDSFDEAAQTAHEHIAADAAAGLARAKGADQPDCLNCGARVDGEYCRRCGQSARSLRRPFHALVWESMETLFALDGRAARTLPALLMRPGRVSRLYLDGARTRFIPPFRLYVLASLIFFVLLPLVMGGGLPGFGATAPNMQSARDQVERAREAGSMTDEEYAEAMAGLDQVDAAWRAGPGRLAPAPRSEDGEGAGQDEAEADWTGLIPPSAIEAIERESARGDPGAERVVRILDDPDRLGVETRRWIPRLMFVLLPVYALLLAMTYLWRRQFLFFDHLIVSLHFHAALFLAMALGVLVAPLIGWGWVALALAVYSNIYLYRLHRTVYGRGRISSALRTLTLDMLYFVVLASAMVVAFTLGAMSV